MGFEIDGCVDNVSDNDREIEIKIVNIVIY